MLFNKVTILGVGLIGASLALALRESGLCGGIYGYGRSEEHLNKAVERGIIDAYSMDAGKACEGADLIVLATPVGMFTPLLEEVKASVKKGAVVTDVGSVKGALAYALEGLVPAGAFYAGSHPITGSDKSGIGDARPGLFKGALCVITPTEKSDREVIQKISALWSGIGGRVEFMDPYEHDRAYAVVSHLPHLIAYELVNTAAEIDGSYLRYAGQGFRDTTRIASSSPELWRDICIYNRKNLINDMDIFIKRLEKVRNSLINSDADFLEKEFAAAKSLKNGLGLG